MDIKSIDEAEKLLDKIEDEDERDYEFNNGFLTAIMLFVEHKTMRDHIVSDEKGNVKWDMRLYGATDHLYAIEIPEDLDDYIKAKIIAWRDKCFENRMENLTDIKIANSLFEEGEDIIALIDRKYFKTKKVKMHYR